MVLLLIIPNVAHAASGYIEASDLVGKEEALRNSTAGSATVTLRKGNITVTKTASSDSKLVILRFTETGGFTENTYHSFINILKAIVSEEYVSYFKGQYPNINIGSKSFSHFKVTKTDNLFEVQVCVVEMEGPTIQAPSATPVPTKTPTPTVNPTPTPTPEISNPSTGDMNSITTLLVIAASVCGIGLSLKKIHE